MTGVKGKKRRQKARQASSQPHVRKGGGKAAHRPPHLTGVARGPKEVPSFAGVGTCILPRGERRPKTAAARSVLPSATRAPVISDSDADAPEVDDEEYGKDARPLLPLLYFFPAPSSCKAAGTQRAGKIVRFRDVGSSTMPPYGAIPHNLTFIVALSQDVIKL